MRYRREIDGLRAIAVLPVILFHAGFRWFSGGYVGVDVFLVISGYLITSLILAEHRAGTFSLVRFYERRARRILPALFFIMLVSLPFAWFLLPPSQLVEFSNSIVAVSTFTSNHFFYSVSGYFDVTAEQKPLLHTWSLGLEEQYYAFFPLAVGLVWRLRKQWLPGLCGVVFIASLALAQVGANVHWLSAPHIDPSWNWWATPPYGFYLLPTRSWEFMIGAFVAFSGVAASDETTLGRFADQSISLLGLGLIAYAVVAFDMGTPFPSIYTLAPTLGAAFVIRHGTPRTAVGKILGNKALVAIGLSSYSAYLWHQPLFVFARLRSVYEPGSVLLVALSIATIVLAYFTWRYVESPFRDARRVSRVSIFVSAALMSAALIGIGLIGRFSGGFVERYAAGSKQTLSDDEKHIIAYRFYNYLTPYREGACFLGAEHSPASFSRACSSEVAAGAKSVLLFGDSYAAAMSSGFHDLIPGAFVQYAAVGCPPVVDVDVPSNSYCRDINNFVMNEARRLQPHAIVLHAHWQAYEEMKVFTRLEPSIAKVKQASPHSKIYIVGGVPQWEPSLPLYLVTKQIALDRVVALFNPRLPAVRRIDSQLSLIARRSGVSFISALDMLCEDGECPAVVSFKDRFEPTVWDNGHLTEAGSLVLARKLLPVVMN